MPQSNHSSKEILGTFCTKMHLLEPCNICLMLLGCIQRDLTPTSDLHSKKWETSALARLHYRKTSWENWKSKEPPRIVERWQHEVIIYCFEYLDHLQDIKTQSLLPVLDYTTMMQACVRMLLKLHEFCITRFEFSANPVARLSLQ